MSFYNYVNAECKNFIFIKIPKKEKNSNTNLLTLHLFRKRYILNTYIRN